MRGMAADARAGLAVTSFDAPPRSGPGCVFRFGGGSDLHLLDGYVPTMESGDILGHEPMGIVVEVGSAVKEGDRVVVPFTSTGYRYLVIHTRWYLQSQTVWLPFL